MRYCKACLLSAAIVSSLILGCESSVCKAEEKTEKIEAVEQAGVTERTEAMKQAETAENREDVDSVETAGNTGDIETTKREEDMKHVCSSHSDEEEWELVEVDGEVYVEPQFSWIDEKKGTFQMEYAVFNHSAVVIPETEIQIELPDVEGFTFEKIFIADGKDTDVQLATDEAERKSFSCFTQNFPIEKRFTIRATGRSVITGTGSTSHGQKKRQEKGREEEQDQTEAAKHIRIAVILRGYGLEHAVNGKYRIPKRRMPKLPMIRQVEILTVNLVDEGKMATEMMLENGIIQRNRIFMSTESEGGHRRLHFFSMKNMRAEVVMAALYKAFVVIIIGFSVFWVSERILMRRADSQSRRRKKIL